MVVAVQDGVVNLSGMAWSDDDIQTAGRVAWGTTAAAIRSSAKCWTVNGTMLRSRHLQRPYASVWRPSIAARQR
jgi:hypothetical protein